MGSDEIKMSGPDIDESDEAEVLKALRSGVLGLGPYAEAFEELCAERAGVGHAVAVSSGTAALHLIVVSLGIGEGDEIIVPSFTFASSVNVVLHERATPVFADIESDTFNIDPAGIEGRITERTKAIMVVDVFGHPAEWDAIAAIAERHDLHLIEDSCEAIGATYRGRPAGGLGRAGTFAFYPNKQITTGEGGMIVTDDAELAGMFRSLRNQGRGAMGSWLEHQHLGYNYRMDELSAALGVSQIRRLDHLLAKREGVALNYTQKLGGRDWVRTPTVRSEVDMSWFVYVVTLAPTIDREAIIGALAAKGIPARAYFTPMHMQDYMRERVPTAPGDLPVTEDVASRTLALPFHANLDEEQIDRVVAALDSVVEATA